MTGRKGTLLVLLLSAMVIFGITGIGNAAVYSVTWDPANIKMDEGETISHWLALSGAGFNPADITSASFLVTLYDDSSSDAGEYARVRVTSDEILLGEVEVDGSSSSPVTYTFGIPTSVINNWLIDDGATWFHLTSRIVFDFSNNDFYFDKVTLQAETVPEPGTMLLLGSGLVGLAGFGRKKFRK